MDRLATTARAIVRGMRRSVCGTLPALFEN